MFYTDTILLLMVRRVCLKKRMTQEFSGMYNVNGIMQTIIVLIGFSATSPGKLLQYLVEDGHHIDAKQPYAEIEVCIMYK